MQHKLYNKQPFFKLVLTILWFFGVFLSAKGQSYYFRHYQVEQGLIHNTVKSIMQDSRGMMWIGTKAGLNRFDGYTFKSFTDYAINGGSIGESSIISICEDKKGMIWIGTETGLFKYDPYHEAFDKTTIIADKSISHILTDHFNNLWFLANNELYKYEQNRNKLTKLNIAATCLMFDKFENLWMGKEIGAIQKLNINNLSSITVQIIDEKYPVNVKSISKVLPVDNEKILIGTYKQGVKCYNTSTGQIQSLVSPYQNGTEITVRDIVGFSDNEYWIATETGIFIYNFKKEGLQHLVKNSSDEYALSDNSAYILYKDNRQNMWVGTYFGGLNYFSLEDARFKKYYPVYGQNSLAGNVVRELTADNLGNVWMGTEDAGISKLNTTSEVFTNYLSGDKSNSLSSFNIQGLQLYNNKLYVGAFMHGLEIMDTATGKVLQRFPLIGD